MMAKLIVLAAVVIGKVQSNCYGDYTRLGGIYRVTLTRKIDRLERDVEVLKQLVKKEP